MLGSTVPNELPRLVTWYLLVVIDEFWIPWHSSLVGTTGQGIVTVPVGERTC